MCKRCVTIVHSNTWEKHHYSLVGYATLNTKTMERKHLLIFKADCSSNILSIKKELFREYAGESKDPFFTSLVTAHASFMIAYINMHTHAHIYTHAHTQNSHNNLTWW